MLGAYGIEAFPSPTNRTLNQVRSKLFPNESGFPSRPDGSVWYSPRPSISLDLHSSSDGGLPVDCVSLTIPKAWWSRPPTQQLAAFKPKTEDSTKCSAESTNLASPEDEWGSLLADALVCCAATSYGFERKPGAGLLGTNQT